MGVIWKFVCSIYFYLPHFSHFHLWCICNTCVFCCVSQQSKWLLFANPYFLFIFITWHCFANTWHCIANTWHCIANTWHCFANISAPLFHKIPQGNVLQIQMYRCFLQIPQRIVLKIHYVPSLFTNTAMHNFANTSVPLLLTDATKQILRLLANPPPLPLSSVGCFALVCGGFCKYNSEMALLQSYLHQLFWTTFFLWAPSIMPCSALLCN